MGLYPLAQLVVQNDRRPQESKIIPAKARLSDKSLTRFIVSGYEDTLWVMSARNEKNG